jgi:hypothetical protein
VSDDYGVFLLVSSEILDMDGDGQGSRLHEALEALKADKTKTPMRERVVERERLDAAVKTGWHL